MNGSRTSSIFCYGCCIIHSLKFDNGNKPIIPFVVKVEMKLQTNRMSIK